LTTERTEQATLAGGCFWCLEAVFDRLQGVERVESGYAGGQSADPSYEQVCAGATGHAEVVQVTFRPDQISFRDLLDVFFTIHDPTTPNRQGADVGTQYRSAIYYHSAEQQAVAEQAVADLERAGVWKDIVTEVAPFDRFYPAEEYHQDFYRRNPNQSYCRIVIDPKVAKLRATFRERLKRT
jgi:peptide-methionine (S)-S-oxide reductase